MVYICEIPKNIYMGTYKKIINMIKTKYFAKQGDVYYIFEVKMLPQPAILPWGQIITHELYKNP